MSVASAPRSAPRSVRRSLASIVLGFELIVVFLAALVNFGLPTGGVITLGPVGSLVAGGVLCVLIIVTLGLLRFRFAYVVGWVVQALIVLGGLFNVAMFFVGALFAGMWAFAMIRGRKIDTWNMTNWNKENA
ncbi:DUF4233 domain-containing protein [Rathayibacter sp. YIM 133350]|uniref:DUF4233 domain-containing protein n=1 Tax=Rathayibacter sp. YIM 133350 TaxID=3131992 RepID=UPI00307FC237